MKKRISIIVFTCLLSFSALHAQLAYTYYPFSSDFGVSTNPDKKFFGDLRMETNTFFSNIDLELNAMFNIKQKERINYYLGAGLNFDFNEIDPVNGIALHAGFRAKPLEKLKRLHFIFEFAPLITSNFQSTFVRTQLGISYHLLPKSQRN